MGYTITQPCIGVKDTACVEVCPVECIHPTKNEETFAKVEQLYIDNTVCIDCGACQAVCPVTAIFPNEQVPEQWKNFIEINDNFFKK